MATKLATLLFAVATGVDSLAASSVSWQLDETITRSDQSLSWVSPTAIDLGLVDYVYDYEITNVTASVRFLFTNIEQDVTDLIGESFDLVGSGAAPVLPTVLIDDAVDDPSTGTMADLRIEVDESGFGRAAFENVVLGRADTPLGRLDIQSIRFQATIDLSGTVPLEPGDYNADGVVDPEDYLLWTQQYGLADRSGVGADGNGDNTVNATDYTVWRDRYDSPLDATVIPEPSCLAIFALGMASHLLRRVRQLGEWGRVRINRTKHQCQPKAILMFGPALVRWLAISTAACLIQAGVSRSETPAAPVAATSSVETLRAPIKKVFKAQDGDHRFVAYLIEWNGTEVIIDDTLGRTDFRVGDKIRFGVHRHKMTPEPGDIEPLGFILLEPDGRRGAEKRRGQVSDEEQDRQQRLVSGDLSVAESELERFYALGKAARKALADGDTTKARAHAEELAGLAEKHPSNWNHGNAIQDSNQVLGMIALAAGRVEEAKERLLASARSEGSPQMNSFGPNMRLAKKLLESGEKEVVLEYFGLCRNFWKMGRDKLTTWEKAATQGIVPSFGANLDY